MPTRTHCWLLDSLAVQQDPQLLLCRAAFQQVGPQPVPFLLCGAVPPQIQDPTFAFVELNSVPLCTPLQLVEVHLKEGTEVEEDIKILIILSCQ